MCSLTQVVHWTISHCDHSFSRFRSLARSHITHNLFYCIMRIATLSAYLRRGGDWYKIISYHILFFFLFPFSLSELEGGFYGQHYHSVGGWCFMCSFLHFIALHTTSIYEREREQECGCYQLISPTTYMCRHPYLESSLLPVRINCF
jgi:hypothetical protein